MAIAVRAAGTRMLSARLITKASPRTIHIVPSVMTNGCTGRADDHQAVQHAADEADGDAEGEADEHGRHVRGRPERAQGERHGHAGQRVDGADREVDARRR